MVQALIGDVKDFWRYSTFSDWAKIGDFRTFFGRKTLFSGVQVMYFSHVLSLVHVELFKYSGSGTSEV